MRVVSAFGVAVLVHGVGMVGVAAVWPRGERAVVAPAPVEVNVAWGEGMGAPALAEAAVGPGAIKPDARGRATAHVVREAFSTRCEPEVQAGVAAGETHEEAAPMGAAPGGVTLGADGPVGVTGGAAAAAGSGVAAGAGGGAPSGGGGAKAATGHGSADRTGWLRLAQSRIFAQRRYPELARRRGIEGVVSVAFRVAPDGSVHDVAVRRGVDPSLDEAAVEAVRAAAPLPPLGPAEIDLAFHLID